MTDPSSGIGERIARRNRRRMYAFVIGTAVLGGVIGSAFSIFDKGNTTGFSPAAIRLDPFAAIILAIALVTALIALPVYAFTIVDEVKVKRNLQAMTAGCLAILGGYPAWQSLAAGGLLPQPSAIGVFALLYITTLVAHVALKLRG